MTTTERAARSRFDELRGRHQRDLLAAVPDHIDRLGWSAATLERHQADRLRLVIDHAMEHSPFHARRLADVDVEHVRPDDLRALPVMTKAELMACFDDVVTDRRVTRAGVEAHLAATGTRPEYLADEVLCLASGGSSGTRGVFAYGWDAAVDFLLGMARGPIARIQALGGPPPGGVPMAMVAAASAVHATRALSEVFAGEVVNPTSVPATLPLREIVRRLNELQPLLLQTYPSVLSRLAQEQSSGRLTLSLLGVTSTSEHLPPAVRALASEAFGVPVADQFGSSEGLLGMSAPDEEPITLASDLAIVELVDEHGEPVPEGVLSHRVLVTTLFNPLMPLLRYELTDRMVAVPASPHHGHVRVVVEGRRDEPLRYGDVEVHPLVVRSALVRSAGVVEYQVRQTERGVDVDIVTSGPVDTDELRGRLTEGLGAAGLSTPQVRVREVSDVARHPETGKVRRFVASA